MDTQRRDDEVTSTTGGDELPGASTTGGYEPPAVEALGQVSDRTQLQPFSP